MNKGFLSGFIASDIKVDEVNLKNGETMKKARFSIACQRKGKGKGADFIQVVALDKTAEIISEWFSKGRGIMVEYRISTGSYTNKDGKKIFTEDKLITDWEFPPVKKSEESQEYANDTHTGGATFGEMAAGNQTPPPAPDFINIPENLDDGIGELPFR